MATCLDTITTALKLAKVLPSGGTPSAAETVDGLACLQSLYDGWVMGGMFGRLEDVYLEEDDVAEEGTRYFVPTGITLTAATSSYVDSCGVTRQPRDLAMYESLTEAGTRSVKLYDRTEWVDLLGLASGDEAPLSKRDSVGLAACLATSGAFIAMFGGEVAPPVILKTSAFLKSLMGKDGSTQDDGQGIYY